MELVLVRYSRGGFKIFLQYTYFSTSEVKFWIQYSAFLRNIICKVMRLKCGFKHQHKLLNQVKMIEDTNATVPVLWAS
jgi:hypothetical protein